MSKRESRAPGRLLALLGKETIQIARDPSSLLIAFVLPLILIFLFGYGVSLDADNVEIGLVVEDASAPAQGLAAAFRASPYFQARVALDRRVFTDDLVAGDVRGIVVIPQDFGRRTSAGTAAPPVQVLTDGSEPNTAAADMARSSSSSMGDAPTPRRSSMVT